VDFPAGPATIATAEDVARAAIMLLDYARARPDASAFVIACFSDPGLDLLRASIPQPVLGLQETGVLTAMARADMFGIIALSPRAAARHRLRLRQMGVLPRMVAELGLSGVSALDAGTSDAVFAETSARGRDLVAMGAGAIVLGCAGFAPRRRALEDALGVAVIDPVQAAAGMALAAALA
jgi:Asp/Glu/hydantoin racemase